jgi:tetratricopeptide (TPR) repeat protein
VDGGSAAELKIARKTAVGGSLLLILACALVFGRVAGFEFLLYDDDKYLTANAAVQSGITLQSMGWALTALHEGTYQPVTWISHLVDVSLFGLDPGPMHVVNLVLHVLASLLVWRIFARTTGRAGAAFVVALLFALHPLQVQSVAWIAERKGLLAAVFGLAAIDQWISYVERGTRRAHAGALACFALSILAKPVWLPLPLLLLLLDRWPLSRKVRLREKFPMFAVAFAGAALAALAQASAQALSSLDEVGIAPRIANAVLAWGATLRRLVAPFDLGAFYPFRFDHPWSLVLLWLAVLVGGSWIAWALRARRPAWFVGWFWWLVLQAPTVGLLQFGAQGTADRFSYLPLIGLIVMLVFGADLLRGRRAAVLALLIVAGAAIQSMRVVAPWHDTVALFERSIELSGGSALEHQNLAQAYLDRGDVRMAMRHSSRAVHFAPYSPTVLFKQADLLFGFGNYVDAFERYREGLKFAPGAHRAWAQVARLYALEKDWEMSARAWTAALEHDPDNPVYILGLAKAMHGKGLTEEELALYQRALQIDPTVPGIRSEIGWIHATSDDGRLRDPDVALRLAETDLRMTGGKSPRAIEVRAAALAALGEREEAIRQSAAAEERALAMGEEELAAEIRERRSSYLSRSP